MGRKPVLIGAVEGVLWLWIKAIEERPWSALAGVLVLCAASVAAAIAFLGVDTDTSRMIDPDLPFQTRALEVREAFPALKEDIVVVVEGSSPDEADAFAAALADGLAAGGEGGAIERAFSASTSDFFRRAGLLFRDLDDLEADLDALTKAEPLLGAVAARPDAATFLAALADSAAQAAQADEFDEIAAAIAAVDATGRARLNGAPRPLSWRALASEEAPGSGDALRTVTVRPRLDFSRLQPAKPAIAEARAAITALEPEFGGRVRTWITGDPALRAEELQSVRTGLGRSLALSFAAVAILLVLGLRSVRLSVYVMISLIVSLVLTTGFAALAVGELNLVSVAFTVLLIGLGLDFAIHLLLHTEEEMAEGVPSRRALLRSVRVVGGALALAAPTTALAFFSFTPTAFAGMAQLGLIAGVGVLVAFAVSITVPVALISISPPRRTRKAAGTVRRTAAAFTSKLADPAALAVLIFGAVCVTLLVPQTRFDADPMALRDPNAQSVRGFNQLFEVDGAAPYRLSLLRSDRAAAAETASRFDGGPLFEGARTAADFVPEDQDFKLDLISFSAGPLLAALDAPAQETTQADSDTLRSAAARFEAIAAPEAAALAETLRRLAEAGLAMEFEDDLFRFWPRFRDDLRLSFAPASVSLEDVPAALRQAYIAADGRWRVEVTPVEDLRDPDALEAFVAAAAEIAPDVAGGAAQTLGAASVISTAVLQATGLSAIVITVVLGLVIGRIVPVLLMLFPLALAGALTLGGGVLLDAPFNYANVIVLPLLIGLGVDSGIHLVMRAEDRRGLFSTSTPRAVLFSALTTAASFGSLMLSPHRGTASMGLLLTVSIAATLAAMLIVLPAVMKRLPPPRRERAVRSPQ
ncbi:MAG: MMPL family transporter [Pseudomonadota bacterium]